MVQMNNCVDRKMPTTIQNYYKVVPKNNILRDYLPCWFDSFIFAPLNEEYGNRNRKDKQVMCRPKDVGRGAGRGCRTDSGIGETHLPQRSDPLACIADQDCKGPRGTSRHLPGRQ